MRHTILLAAGLGLAALVSTLGASPLQADESPAPAASEQAPSRGLMPALRAADADRDGTVTAEEWAAHLKTLTDGFAKLDADGDGAVRTAELPRRPRARRMRDRRAGPQPGQPPEFHRAHAGPGGPPPPPHPPRGQPPGRRGPLGPHGHLPPQAGGPDRPRPPAGRDGPHSRAHERGPRPKPEAAGLEARLDRLIRTLEALLEKRDGR